MGLDAMIAILLVACLALWAGILCPLVVFVLWRRSSRQQHRLTVLEHRLAALAAPVAPAAFEAPFEAAADSSREVAADSSPAFASASNEVAPDSSPAAEWAPEASLGQVAADSSPVSLATPAEVAPDSSAAFASTSDEVAPDSSVAAEWAPEASFAEVAPDSSPASTAPLAEVAADSSPVASSGESGGTPGFDWESWLGVRGAAALGGVVLALAAIYLFRYSIEQGWLAPIVRVVLAVVGGGGAVAASSVMRRRGYAWAADALAAGGCVAMYAGLWAAHGLYDLIGPRLAAVLMAAVTVLCVGLAARRRSQLIAVVGLAGGFVTPWAISALRQDPFWMAVYLLLLDGGLLLLARSRKWSRLHLLAMAGTALYQLYVLAAHVEDDPLLSLGVVIVPALLLSLVPLSFGVPRRLERWSRIAALGVAGLLLVPIASVRSLGVEPGVFAAALLSLAAAACWLDLAWARTAASAGPPAPGGPVPGRLALGAAAASVLMLSLWIFGAGNPFPGLLAVSLCAAVAGVFHLFACFGDGRMAEAARWAAQGLLLASAGLQLSGEARTVWPWVGLWLFLAALSFDQARAFRQGRRFWEAGALLAMAFAAVHFGGGSSLGPSWRLWGVAVAAGAGLLAASWYGRKRAGEPGADDGEGWTDLAIGAERGALTFSLGMLALAGQDAFNGTVDRLLAVRAFDFGFLAALAAWRHRAGRLFALAAAGTFAVLAAAAQAVWEPGAAVLLLGAALLAGAGTAAPPFLSRGWGRRSPSMGWTAGAAPLAVFFAASPLAGKLTDAAHAEAITALALAAAAALGALWVRRYVEAGSEAAALGLGPARLSSTLAAPRSAAGAALLGFAASAAVLAALAVGLGFGAVGRIVCWTAEGLALAALWRRWPHPGPRVAAAAAVGLALFQMGFYTVAGELPPELAPGLGVLLLAHGLPALLLLAGAHLLREGKGTRSAWSGTFLASAIGVGFLWLNRSLLHVFQALEELAWGLDRLSLRDLSLSAGWVLYALVLLTAGVRGRSRAVRGTALGLLAVTAVKVFLYDLSELTDLYRVASLLALAGSLLLVSLAFQRFVIRARKRSFGPTAPPAPPG